MGVTFVNSQSSTGTCTLTQAAGNGVTWNLSSLSVSMAGPTIGPNAKLTIYDGAVGGTVLFACFLGAPVQAGMPTGGSVGTVQEIPLPRTPQGLQSLQSLPGNAMNIQVVGTGVNTVSINARFSDGLP
jgi:hypothetical protein